MTVVIIIIIIIIIIKNGVDDGDMNGYDDKIHLLMMTAKTVIIKLK